MERAFAQSIGGTICIDPKFQALILEDDIGRRHWFLSRHRLPHAMLADSSERAIDLVQRFDPDVIFIDYDLTDGKTSEEFAHFLALRNRGEKIIVHSANPFGREVLSRILPAAQIAPFGSFEIAAS